MLDSRIDGWASPLLAVQDPVTTMVQVMAQKDRLGQLKVPDDKGSKEDLLGFDVEEESLLEKTAELRNIPASKNVETVLLQFEKAKAVYPAPFHCARDLLTNKLLVGLLRRAAEPLSPKVEDFKQAAELLESKGREVASWDEAGIYPSRKKLTSWCSGTSEEFFSKLDRRLSEAAAKGQGGPGRGAGSGGGSGQGGRGQKRGGRGTEGRDPSKRPRQTDAGAA